MNIYIVGWGVEPEFSGGMDVHVSRIAEFLAASGHVVRLFVPSFNAGRAPAGVILQEIDAGLMPGDLHGIISYVKKYNRMIVSSLKNADFDVIHTHDWLGADAGFQVKQKLGKKWVHTVHSLEFMRRGEELNAKKSSALLSQQSLARRSWLHAPIERLETLAILNADEAITVSKFMQEIILKKYSRNVRVIYNAPSVSCVPAGARREENRVFFAGRLAEQKGLKYLAYSAKRVLEEFPQARFVIAGVGHLAEPLIEFAKSLGIEKSVSFLGFVDRERLVEEYQKAAIFVSPSVFEPFGITILDAAVLGAPILATERTGALELFSKDSVAVVEPGDSDALAKNIIALLRDKKMRERMAERANKDVEKASGWKEIAGEVEERYVSLYSIAGSCCVTQ